MRKSRILTSILMAFGVFFLTCDFCRVETKAIGINGAPSSDTPQGIAHDLVEVGAFVPDGHGGYIITEKGMDELSPHWRENPDLVKTNPWKNSQPAQAPVNVQLPSTPAITPEQAAQIQAAQQKALAANPTANPAAIYLQTLQANGYTLDATGKIVPIAK